MNNRRSRWILVCIILFWSVTSSYGQGTPANIKGQFMDSVRSTMEKVNTGLTRGIAYQFFSIGDPNRFLSAIDSWLLGVALDPDYVRDYSVRAPVDRAGKPPRAITQEEVGSWDILVTPKEEKYNRWIVLSEPLTNASMDITAFHEAIHAYHLAVLKGTSVDDDDYEGPELITGEWYGVLRSLGAQDARIPMIKDKISKLEDYYEDLMKFRKAIEQLRARIEGNPPPARQAFECLQNIGGKMDWDGYKNSYEGEFASAMRQTCPKVQDILRQANDALKKCEFDAAKTPLDRLLRLSNEHLAICNATSAADIEVKVSGGIMQWDDDKNTASDLIKTGGQAYSTAKAAASEVVAARKSLESFNDELGNKLKIEPDMLRVKEDVARECAEVERLFREIDLKAKDARAGSSNARVEYDKTEEARRKACDLATQAEKCGDKNTAVAYGTQATDIAKRAYDSMKKARDEATLAARVAGDAEADSHRLDGLIKKLKTLETDLPKKREDLKKAIDPDRLKNVQATAEEADAKKEDVSKASQEAIDAESNLLSLWFVKECSGRTEVHDAVKKARQATLDTGQEADEALKSAERAKKAVEKIDKRVQKIKNLVLLIGQIERHLQTCTRKPDQLLDASAAKRASDDASGFATRAYANSVEAEKCAHRARMAGESLGEVDPATLEKMIVGNWKWFNVNLVEISDHKMVAKDGKGNILNSGSWSLSNAKNREFTLQWEKGGWVDKLTLSSDGKRLDGKNNVGSSVWGTRAK